MLTRGKHRAAPGTVGTSAGSKKASSKRTTPTASKRTRTGQWINSLNGSHPSQLQRQPLAPPQNVLSVDIGTPAASSSSVPNIPSGSSIPVLTSAISAAVIKGLTDAGIFTSTNVNVAQNTSQTVAAVQESVADVVDNLTGEGHDILNPNHLDTCDSNNRPQQVHKLICVPLVSRVPEKIQAKIWANEYVELGSLCYSIPGDPKYNFTVKTPAPSNQPVVTLEPVQNTKRITTIDHWTSAFQIFVAIYTVRFPESAPALVKYSATVHDLAAKNAHWKYYDENFRYLRQKFIFPWDDTHWELWLQAHHMNRNSSQTAMSGSSSARPFKQPFFERLLLEISPRGQVFWV